MLLIPLFLLMASEPLFTLDDVDLYAPSELSLYDLPNNHLLIVSYKEDALVLLGRDFQVVAAYRAAGLGPQELHRPYILGVDEHSIYVASNRSRVLKFSHQLELTGTLAKLPSAISRNLASGLINAEGNFLRTGYRGAEHLVLTIAPSNNGWDIISQHFESGTNPANRMAAAKAGELWVARFGNRNLFVHHGGVLAGSDNYEVRVFGAFVDNQSEDLTQVLMGRTDGLKPFIAGMSAFVKAVAKTDDGWLVSFNARGPRPGVEYAKNYLDSFALDGTFLSRREYQGVLLPSVNGSTVLLLTDDGEFSRLN